jgi:hypothetical protein
MQGAAVFTPLELPGREAPNVEMELVGFGVAAVAPEQDLDLQLVAGRGLVANGADCANARPAPGAIGSAARELSALNCRTCLRAQKLFVGHLRYLGTTRAMHTNRKGKPDARGFDARSVFGNPKEGNYKITPYRRHPAVRSLP